MEDQKLESITNALVRKSKKKKHLPQDQEMLQSLGAGDTTKRSHDKRTVSGHKGKKASKRGFTNDVSPLFHQERLAPDSLTSGNEYRMLRRKYLMLEEESFGLGRELKEVEDGINTLEEEKLSLLDELVVLEGLIDPIDLQPQGQRLP